MKKFVLFLVLMVCSVGRCATFTAQGGGGNWSSNATWGKAAGAVEGVNYPGNGDAVDLADQTVVMDIASVPATGTLLSLTASSTGNLTLTMSGTNAYVIKATTITSGTASGIIKPSGAAAGSSLTITGNVLGGAGNAAYGVAFSGTGTCNIVGTVTGGTGATTTTYGATNSGNGTLNITGAVTGGAADATAYGVYATGSGATNITGNVAGGAGAATSYGASNSGTGTMTIAGNVTGGSGAATAYGIYSASTGIVVINGNVTGGTVDSTNHGVLAITGTTNTVNGNLVNSTEATAWSGKPPTLNGAVLVGDKYYRTKKSYRSRYER